VLAGLMPFELRVALRYLTARRKQAFISVISGISILGVAVGVMAVLIALGLMTGLQTEVRSRILGATAHISLFPGRSDFFEDYREVVVRLRRLPRVLGSAPALYGKGVISSTTGQQLATLKGIVPGDEQTVTDLAAQADPGAMAALTSGGGGLAPILLGKDMAESLAVGAGDVVTVTVPQGRLSPMGVLPRVDRYRVAGLVTSGLYEFDASWAYLPLAVAQRLLQAGDRVTLLEVRVDDMYAVKDIEPAILKALGDGFVVQDWIDMNRSLFSALWLEKTAIAITIGLIVMVAALNIVATLILMVMEKHKDIAILAAMGASRRGIARIFMLQGSIIGACGTMVGASLGWGACWILDHYRLIRVPQDVYQVSYVPFTLLPRDAAVVILAALLTCFVATIYPARGAARLDPAEALRYE
jgi:lipoprotein-releasing system permease protein